MPAECDSLEGNWGDSQIFPPKNILDPGSFTVSSHSREKDFQFIRLLQRTEKERAGPHINLVGPASLWQTPSSTRTVWKRKGTEGENTKDVFQDEPNSAQLDQAALTPALWTVLLFQSPTLELTTLSYKGQNYMIVSMAAENVVDEVQHPFIILNNKPNKTEQLVATKE